MDELTQGLGDSACASIDHQSLTRPTGEQRRSQRHAADCAAQYRLDPADPWRDCRVINVSRHGAALELHGAVLDGGLTGPIEIRIASTAGEDVGATIRAVIRRHERLDDGRIVTGIEYSVLQAEEENLLRLLVGLRALC